MMVKARGPVWHQKQKKQGIVPPRLHGLDKEATWGKSNADGWVYGHGTFSMVEHRHSMLGVFQWMPNSGNEAKRMEREAMEYDSLIKNLCMDSKADDQKMYWNLKENHGIQLITNPRKGMDKSPERKAMIKDMQTKKNFRIYRKRSVTVEPMQGLVADIFELDRCWMRRDESNRWLFAAMGVAVQIAQWHAYQKNKSTREIKSWVTGV